MFPSYDKPSFFAGSFGQKTPDGGFGKSTPFFNAGGASPFVAGGEDPAYATSATQVYTSFEDLPNYGTDVNVVEVLDLIRKSFEDKSNWKSTFDALDNLRILNKFYPHDVNNIFEAFGKYIMEGLESVRSNIAKNSLIFIKEVFTYTCRSVKVADEIISEVIPVVLSKCFSDKAFIKAEAQECITQFLENCVGDISIITLCRSCFDKNVNICELSMQAIAKMIESLGENISRLSNDTIAVLMKSLARIVDGKRASMAKIAQQICEYMIKLFGPDNYLNVMSQVLTEEEGSTMMRTLENKKDKSSRPSHLHEVLREQKLNAFGGGGNPF
eukprot:TRINITY_DN13064_c0_g1_i3.p2 TRINITY_DN13064_c0_g1~~TRINITY_DN13064_c0_g1_i3.p2  ORF type:complete len:328 (-),score=80.44 TRINITY_DN13064_c0_g1_i3:1814-2797(-)